MMLVLDLLAFVVIVAMLFFAGAMQAAREADDLAERQWAAIQPVRPMVVPPLSSQTKT